MLAPLYIVEARVAILGTAKRAAKPEFHMFANALAIKSFYVMDRRGLNHLRHCKYLQTDMDNGG